MGQGGMLIRLIDVVFILLFGFIAISEVTYRSKINLPKSTQTPPSYPDQEEIIFIGIMPNGTYLVENETLAIRDTKTLNRYLSNKFSLYKNQGILLRVRIRSAWNAQIKYMMAAADICDNLGIPKGMDVEKR